MNYNQREIATLGNIIAYSKYRNLFKEASSLAVKKIFEKHIDSNDKLLEIGSGLGWLVEIVPDYKSRIKQSEGFREILDEHLRLTPTSNIIYADFYNLPFDTASFDVVVGLNVFDHLSDLERSLLSIYSVLDKNGKVIHLRDMTFVPESLSSINYDRNKFVPFPAFDETYKFHLGMRLVPKKLARKIDRFDAELKTTLMGYLSNPEKIYESALLKDRQLSKALAYMGEALAPNSSILDFRDYFLNYLKNTFQANGFKIVDTGISEGEVNVDRGHDHKGSLEDNIFFNDAGRYITGTFEDSKNELKPGYVKMVSQVQYIVAQK